MSGFCVLGVSRQKLETIVSRRVAALERRLKCPPPARVDRAAYQQGLGSHQGKAAAGGRLP